ncbi:MAG: hypothetical protein WCK42_09715, partial [Myxococcaceae bacterium]
MVFKNGGLMKKFFVLISLIIATQSSAHSPSSDTHSESVVNGQNDQTDPRYIMIETEDGVSYCYDVKDEEFTVCSPTIGPVIMLSAYLELAAVVKKDLYCLNR